MIPYRPVRYRVEGALGQLKVNDAPPSTVEVVQTVAAVLATGAGATLTLLGMSRKDTALTSCLKLALATGLLTISISTAIFGFQLD